jgi:hypothetical protein
MRGEGNGLSGLLDKALTGGRGEGAFGETPNAATGTVALPISASGNPRLPFKFMLVTAMNPSDFVGACQVRWSGYCLVAEVLRFTPRHGKG